jgi:hypothetical protein
MNVLEKIPKSVAGPKQIDKAELLEILRLSIMVGFGALLEFCSQRFSELI